MMRRLAWWGTSSEMSSGPSPASAMARSADSTTTRTARRKTSLPSMNERAAVLALEQVPERAVGVQVPAEQAAGAVDRLDHHGAGAVADDDGDLAVVHVGDARERLGADEQDGPGPDGDEAGHGDEAVDEARARRVEVERAAADADAVLHGRRRARDDAVGGGGGQHEVVDLVGACARRRPAPPAPASMARPEVVPPMRRSRMPVRSTIHSSLVSRLTAMSSLVTTLSGTAMPQPVIRMPLTRRTRRGRRGCRRSRRRRR